MPRHKPSMSNTSYEDFDQAEVKELRKREKAPQPRYGIFGHRNRTLNMILKEIKQDMVHV
jgi:hypothetical protein